MKKVVQPKSLGLDPQHPVSSEEVFLQGWSNCHDGKGKHQNPYNADTEAYEWWRRGWENRYYNEPHEMT